MPRRKTQEEFIQNLIRVHGSKYDYSKVHYLNNRTKVILICKDHGEFLKSPNSLIDMKQGCPICGRIQANQNIRLSWDEVLNRFNSTHGDTYDYLSETYIDYTTDMTIVCRIHGEFVMKPHSHVSMKAGCRECGYLRVAEKNTISLDEIVLQFKQVHKSFYEYDLTSYRGVEHKIRIKCPYHGWFKQKVSSHKSGSGCRKCSDEKIGDRTRINFEMWIEQSKLTHGNLYDYSKVAWVDQFTPVMIGCDVEGHGFFEQSPRDHKRGSGCTKCNASKGEMAISRWLTDHGIEFIPQWSHPELKFRTLLYCDFYLPGHTMVIEYNGIQHYSPIELFDGEKGLDLTKKRDEIKKQFCLQNGISFVVIKYNQDVVEKLRETFGFL